MVENLRMEKVVWFMTRLVMEQKRYPPVIKHGNGRYTTCMKIGADVPIETTMKLSGFPIATFDYRRVLVVHSG